MNFLVGAKGVVRIVNPIISMRFRSRGLPTVESTLRILGNSGGDIVRITRRVKGGAMHYVVLTSDRKLRESVRMATANTNVGAPIKRRALNELFGILNRTVSNKTRPSARRG